MIRGGSEKFWPLAQVSNSSITEQEWFHYQQGESDTRAKGGRELTRGDVERARKRLLEAENYTYSEKDVAELLRSKKAVVKNVAMVKARLERERDAALQRGENELAAELDRDILKLEEESAKRRKEDKMAKVNAKNAQKNFEDGLAFREDGLEKGNDEMDPFRRRVTRPMIYWKTKHDGDGGGGDGGGGNDGVNGGRTEANEAKEAKEDEELVVEDVRDTIRQLLAHVSDKEHQVKSMGCSSLYNPNSNIRRRMLSRKFNTAERDDSRHRARVYHGLEAYMHRSEAYTHRSEEYTHRSGARYH